MKNMIALSFQQRKFTIKSFAEHFVEDIKINCVIKPLQKIYSKRFYDDKLMQMRNLPINTVGNDIAKMLDENNLKLIPKFEEHDLKHLILEYGMTAQEEIKMQAYLFGNGNRRVSCVLFLLSGILFPSLWKEYYQEYKKGKSAPSISQLTIEDCISLQTNDMKKRYKINGDTTMP